MLYFDLDQYIIVNTDGSRSRRWKQMISIKLNSTEDESMTNVQLTR